MIAGTCRRVRCQGNAPITGRSLAPDGRLAQAKSIRFVSACDMPERGAPIKIKGPPYAIAENTIKSLGLFIGCTVLMQISRYHRWQI